VKLEPVFDLCRDFDREGRVLRRTTGYRQQHMRLAAFVFPERSDNGTRAVLLALDASMPLFQTYLQRMMRPETGQGSAKPIT
jgi:hypothetical protein